MATRKEKEILSVLSDAVYVVTSGHYSMHDCFIPFKVFPGRYTIKECEDIINFQREKWKKNPPKQKSKNPKFHFVHIQPQYKVYHYKEVPKI